jgi:hypothetical protein
MKNTVRSIVTLAVSLGLAVLSSAGQVPSTVKNAGSARAERFNLGLTYTYKIAKISTTADRFQIQGGSVDGVFWLGGKVRNLGLAFDLDGETASNITPGVNLSQITFVAGPRYTLWRAQGSEHRPGFNIFGEGLGGVVHASNSVFPTSTFFTSSANSFSVQLGGGIDLPLSQRLGLRLIQADYILTKLPNANNDLQGDVRLSGGITFNLR